MLVQVLHGDVWFFFRSVRQLRKGGGLILFIIYDWELAVAGRKQSDIKLRFPELKAFKLFVSLSNTAFAFNLNTI